jgi:peptide/nickel transport system permease protein
MAERLLPPSARHWFGTDTLGRDLLARVLAGGRVSMGIGLAAAALSTALALPIGLYGSGVLGPALMGLCDALRSIPSLLLALALTTALGGNTVQVILALALGFTPVTARLVRSSVLAIRGQPYIDAARIQGAGRGRILFCHILPNILSPLGAQVSFICAQAMTVEAALSFLGAGVQPPLPSWGGILQEGQTVIFSAPWMILFPGLFTALTILGINFLGDGLQGGIST